MMSRDKPSRRAMRMNARTGINPWNAEQAILFARGEPRAHLAGHMAMAQHCRRLPDPQYRATARLHLDICRRIRAGTYWGISTPRPLP